eukprot:TRINITY_DN2394_c0_g1_i2.p1 TRINITY_DN2394_c0_g1~~TRINITY_DN2394_c0_g1_i2.p1  ORF type:complete len:530 (+),score=43.52 TRINITY_DN2394_c0_g1_i2:220-1809(+)
MSRLVLTDSSVIITGQASGMLSRTRLVKLIFSLLKQRLMFKVVQWIAPQEHKPTPRLLQQQAGQQWAPLPWPPQPTRFWLPMSRKKSPFYFKMITYSKRLWGLQLLFRLYGSAFPRAVPFALLSMLITLLLKVFMDPTHASNQYINTLWEHPYPFQTFAFIVGFVIVFRSNFGYQRYMEGRTNLQMMTSKWTDGVIQALNFDKYNQEDSAEARFGCRVFSETFVHLVSLLHGLACQNLRRDFDLCNLVTHNTQGDVPPKDPLNLKYQHLNLTRGSVSPQKSSRPQNLGFIGFMLGDMFVLRSDSEAMKKIHSALPIPIVAGLTAQECKRLGLHLPENRIQNSHGMNCGYYCGHTYVPGPMERVHTAAMWIHQYIMQRRLAGGLQIDPPILSRMYQVFSEGLGGYEQCRKLNDTPFPFPWAQAVLAFLLLFALVVPLVVCGFIKSTWLACLLTFLAVSTYWTLNEIARDLEDPFWYDPNDLPLAYYQYAFNERILVISRTQRPLSNTEAMALNLTTNMPEPPDTSPLQQV